MDGQMDGHTQHTHTHLPANLSFFKGKKLLKSLDTILKEKNEKRKRTGKGVCARPPACLFTISHKKLQQNLKFLQNHF